jgi:hypothetical protein
MWRCRGSCREGLRQRGQKPASCRGGSPARRGEEPEREGIEGGRASRVEREGGAERPEVGRRGRNSPASILTKYSEVLNEVQVATLRLYIQSIPCRVQRQAYLAASISLADCLAGSSGPARSFGLWRAGLRLPRIAPDTRAEPSLPGARRARPFDQYARSTLIRAEPSLEGGARS